MIKIKSKDSSYGIKFPESVNEIKEADLKTALRNVKLPKHYAVVALAFETSLFEFAIAMNKPAQESLNVTPILAYISDEDKENLNANVGEKIIITRSSLERGVHLTLPLSITSVNAASYIRDKKDVYLDIIKNANPDAKKKIILLEFKIVPIVDIAAAIDRFEYARDPFVIEEVASVN